MEDLGRNFRMGAGNGLDLMMQFINPGPLIQIINIPQAENRPNTRANNNNNNNNERPP